MPQLWIEVNLKSKSILKTKRTKFYSVLYYLYFERKVLSIFKKLYRIKQKVYFENVDGPIFARGQNFNDHLKQNKHIDDSAKIQELIQFGSECDWELRRNVIQAVQRSEKVKIRRKKLGRNDGRPKRERPASIKNSCKRGIYCWNKFTTVHVCKK